MKHSDRNKVTFSNPKVQRVLAALQIGENRITRQELLSLSNKDILYQLKNSNYIRELQKDLFIGTTKLHKHVLKTDGKHFSSSCSEEHALAVRNSLSLLPSSVLTRKAYETSYDIEKKTERRFKTDPDCRARLEQLKQNQRMALDEVEQKHRAFNSTSASGRYAENLRYQREREEHLSTLGYLNSDRPYLTPDYQVRLTDAERLEYIANLTEYKNSFAPHEKAYAVCVDAIEKLSALQGEVTLSVEVIRNTYGNRELIMHHHFETIFDVPQIMLM
ncbi:MAG: hypothetical protein J6K15_14275 [Lachnospiraceae bacterium]|nr:hypothetical protein [Lachnospiraceae bacterium]